MSISKHYIIENGLEIQGDLTFTGILTGDGSGLIGVGGGVTSYNDLTDKPTLFSGSYTDLTNKPTLFSGSYNDLTNKPIIPTALSSLSNDSGYVTESYVSTQISNLINGAPGALDTLNELALALGNDSNYASTITNALALKANTSSLATVATSGNYNDLSNIPNVPNLSFIYGDVTPGPSNQYNLGSPSRLWAGLYIGSNGINLSGPLTTFGGVGSNGWVLKSDNGLPVWSQLSYNNLADKPTLFSGSYTDLTNKPTIPTVPTNVSSFTNDSNYATQTYVSTQIGNLINGAPAALDTLNELASALGNDANYASTITNALALKANTSSLATVATTGSYTDLTNTPTIPTNTNQLTNGAGFITGITSTNVTTALGFTPIQLSSLSIGTTAPAAGSGALAYNAGVFTYTPPAISSLLTGASTVNVQFASLGVGVVYSGTAGEIRASNNITAYYSSDARLKENIQDIDNALDKVCAIGSKTFDWTDDYIAEHGGEDGYFVQKSDFGVIAQDVQEVFPQAVRTREDGTLAVDYEKLATLAFGAIKELSIRLKNLEDKVN